MASGKNRFSGPATTLADLFPERLRQMAAQASTREKILRRGDVVWLELPQNLSDAHDPNIKETKTRPFIVLDNKVSYRVDDYDLCEGAVAITGMDSTSKPYLINNRPHIIFQMPGEMKPTYALIDSVRMIIVSKRSLEPAYHFSEQELASLNVGLNTSLQPERRFFESWRSKQFMPGQIWKIHTVNKQEALAMILVRRGKSFINSPPYDMAAQEVTSRRSKYSPYLVVILQGHTVPESMRGIRWNDMEIMAINEHSFLSQLGQQGEMSKEVVGVLLNNLRLHVGLLPLAYREPILRNATNTLLSLLIPRPIGFGLRL